MRNFLRKASLLFLIFALVMGFAACNAAPAESESKSESASESESESQSQSESLSESESESESETESESESESETEPAEPKGSTILRGTPVIDGVWDEIYANSFCYVELPMVNLNYAPLGEEVAEAYMGNTEGTAYYLYDDEYLYVCAEIYDETICSRGEEWRMETVWPWNDDGAEIYLWFSDEDCMAIHGDAAGIRAVKDVHIFGDNHDTSKIYEDLPEGDFCATIDEENNIYTVEMRIPLPDYVQAGSMIGTLLEIDDRWAVGPDTDKMVGALYAFPRYPGAENFLVELSEYDAY